MTDNSNLTITAAGAGAGAIAGAAAGLAASGNAIAKKVLNNQELVNTISNNTIQMDAFYRSNGAGEILDKATGYAMEQLKDNKKFKKVAEDIAKNATQAEPDQAKAFTQAQKMVKMTQGKVNEFLNKPENKQLKETFDNITAKFNETDAGKKFASAQEQVKKLAKNTKIKYAAIAAAAGVAIGAGIAYVVNKVKGDSATITEPAAALSSETQEV